MSEKTKAVVLLSGGLDSTTVLALALDEGRDVHAVSFDYGQRHRHELKAAERIASALGAREHRMMTIDLRAIGGSALTDDIPVPKDDLGGQDVPITYVPARNLIFLSFAVGYAEAIGADEIWIGVNAIDYSGYPDCRPEFIEALQKAVNEGTKSGVEEGKPKIVTPLINSTKPEIIRRGTELGVDYSMTRSCYDPDDAGLACGHCDSCLLRKRGFEGAGVPDPTRYSD
ncbi:MAG: 7-cyano-7-deazaguanine synthase QueC [Thermoanaerobaculia bacterium]|nr:7-cyano-7-deazaguanine synthase QueC [Thermoanaerobaculia bacterium]